MIRGGEGALNDFHFIVKVLEVFPTRFRCDDLQHTERKSTPLVSVLIPPAVHTKAQVMQSRLRVFSWGLRGNQVNRLYKNIFMDYRTDTWINSFPQLHPTQRIAHSGAEPNRTTPSAAQGLLHDPVSSFFRCCCNGRIT